MWTIKKPIIWWWEIRKSFFKIYYWGQKTFFDVYGRKDALYLPAASGGSRDAKLRSLGVLTSKKKSKKFEKTEKQMSDSSSSISSESESTDEERAKQPKNLSQEEIKQYFKELMQQAADATLKFFVDSIQAEMIKRENQKNKK